MHLLRLPHLLVLTPLQPSNEWERSFGFWASHGILFSFAIVSSRKVRKEKYDQLQLDPHPVHYSEKSTVLFVHQFCFPECRTWDECISIPSPSIPALASIKGQGVALPGLWRREGPALGRWLNPVSGPSDSTADVSKHPLLVKLLPVLGKLILFYQVVNLFPFRDDDETAHKLDIFAQCFSSELCLLLNNPRILPKIFSWPRSEFTENQDANQFFSIDSVCLFFSLFLSVLFLLFSS